MSVQFRNQRSPQVPFFLSDPDVLKGTAKHVAIIQNLLFQLGGELGGKFEIEYRGRDLNHRDIMILSTKEREAPPAPPPAARESLSKQPTAPPAARESLSKQPTAPPAARESLSKQPMAPPSAARESLSKQPVAPPAPPLPDPVIQESPDPVFRERSEKREEPIANKDSQKQQDTSKSSQEPAEMGFEEQGEERVKDLEKEGPNSGNASKSENKPGSQMTNSRGLENAFSARSKEAQSEGTRETSSSSSNPGAKSGAQDQIIQNRTSISLNGDKNGGKTTSQPPLSQNNEKLMVLPKTQAETVAKSEFTFIAMGKNGEFSAKALIFFNFNGTSSPSLTKGLEASLNNQQLASSSKAAFQTPGQTTGLADGQKALARETQQNQGNPSLASQTKGSEATQPNPSVSSLMSDNKAGAEASKSAQTGQSIAQPQTLVVSSRSEISTALQMQFKSQTTLPLMVMVPLSTSFRKEGSGVSGDGRASEESKKTKEKGPSSESSDQGMAFVPEGPTLFGPEGVIVDVEAFLIATTAVTNAQYAFWLNKKNKEGKVFITKGGEIRDASGMILCKTFEKESTSQIRLIVSNGELLFAPLKNMDHYPVVHVSWFGAHEFCRDNGLRLPTEVEWEKSAGMHIGEPLRRNRYGCGDEITIASVNYNQKYEKRATPVGFYNGSTVFAQGYNTIQTDHAISPYGCYDMSGNVREWVDEQVTKGGSYDSPLEELEVVSRVPLHPHTTDAYTGFRVVISI